jgi:hypothetical protein
LATGFFIFNTQPTRKVFLRDIIDLEATNAGPDAKARQRLIR